MNDRADELIRTLGLVPHPEGGRFSEVFRSVHRVKTADGLERAAFTAIHYLLVAGERSRWHRVARDEAWHFYEGQPLELRWIAEDWSVVEHRTLSQVAAPGLPVAVVPAGCWQCARPAGRYALVGCTVGPGFEASEFALMRDHKDKAQLRERFPEWIEFL